MNTHSEISPSRHEFVLNWLEKHQKFFETKSSTDTGITEPEPTEAKYKYKTTPTDFEYEYYQKPNSYDNNFRQLTPHYLILPSYNEFAYY
ncbi:hypothetical protein HW555_010875 [Spodoptera exigua]|uniref:Uncharacterized protein n=1 Tax=Spodoptera exigua TaxID=7107 RepID=A0A835L569_SPOEX|nr:hypothetical protein HW555_010875 [Spodoptera exigua]